MLQIYARKSSSLSLSHQNLMLVQYNLFYLIEKKIQLYNEKVSQLTIFKEKKNFKSSQLLEDS